MFLPVRNNVVLPMISICRRRVAIEDTIVQKGTVTFQFCDVVVGLTNAKQALKEAIIMPLQLPQLFTGEIISLCSLS